MIRHAMGGALAILGLLWVITCSILFFIECNPFAWGEVVGFAGMMIIHLPLMIGGFNLLQLKMKISERYSLYVLNLFGALVLYAACLLLVEILIGSS